MSMWEKIRQIIFSRREKDKEVWIAALKLTLYTLVWQDTKGPFTHSPALQLRLKAEDQVPRMSHVLQSNSKTGCPQLGPHCCLPSFPSLPPPGFTKERWDRPDDPKIIPKPLWWHQTQASICTHFVIIWKKKAAQESGRHSRRCRSGQ